MKQAGKCEKPQSNINVGVMDLEYGVRKVYMYIFVYMHLSITGLCPQIQSLLQNNISAGDLRVCLS